MISSCLLDEQLIFALPSVPFRYPEGLPRVSCVYFVVDSSRNLKYIGRCKDLLQRFTGDGSTKNQSNGWSHKVFYKALRFDDVLDWYIYYQEMPQEDLHSVERQYISKYTPVLNVSIPKRKYEP